MCGTTLGYAPACTWRARHSERAAEIGGGTRTAELTLPGVRHDVCSAVHPLAVGSPFLATLPLAEHGLTLLEPAVAAAHPLDDGSAAALHRSLAETADALGRDGRAYRALVGPLARDWERLCAAPRSARRPRGRSSPAPRRTRCAR